MKIYFKSILECDTQHKTLSIDHEFCNVSWVDGYSIPIVQAIIGKEYKLVRRISLPSWLIISHYVNKLFNIQFEPEPNFFVPSVGFHIYNDYFEPKFGMMYSQFIQRESKLWYFPI